MRSKKKLSKREKTIKDGIPAETVQINGKPEIVCGESCDKGLKNESEEN